MIKIAVCDDEKIFLEELYSYINKIFTNHGIKIVVNLFRFSDDLINRILYHHQRYDIILLDIDMPEQDGFKTAELLRSAAPHFKLVFITSLSDEVLNSFEYNVSAFIPKSNLNEYLSKHLLRIAAEIHKEKAALHAFEIEDDNANKIIIRFRISDIYYFECVNRVVEMVTNQGRFVLAKRNFDEIKSKYADFDFVSIHRTCIVNISHIYIINEIDLVLDNHEVLPVSRRQRKKLKELLSDFANREVFYD